MLFVVVWCCVLLREMCVVCCVCRGLCVLCVVCCCVLWFVVRWISVGQIVSVVFAVWRVCLRVLFVVACCLLFVVVWCVLLRVLFVVCCVCVVCVVCVCVVRVLCALCVCCVRVCEREREAMSSTFAETSNAKVEVCFKI